MSVATAAIKVGWHIVDLLLPPRCVSCAVEISGQQALCPDCWSGLRLLAPPWCRICGYPLPHAVPDAPICPRCVADQPPFDRARAALRYDDQSKRLILAFKHGGRLDGVDLFADWMVRAGADILEAADVLVPVPLHRWRLVKRGFNQSAVLSKAVARRTGRQWLPHTLRRHRATASQQGLSAEARRENITAASFRLARNGSSRIEGRRVVLVDDVLTTGATLGACASVLRRAGAAQVDALLLARVVKDAGSLI
ncbi:MAG: ComF family protein [Geminicoccaceae bacterium]